MSAITPVTTTATIKAAYQNLCETFQGQHRADLTARLIAGQQWQADRANQAITQYLMFLSLASIHRDQCLVPTADIDCVWEMDILQNTAQYIQLCQRLCGETIHHISGNNVEFNKIETAFNQTLLLLFQQFGKDALGKAISPAAACGVLISPN